MKIPVPKYSIGDVLIVSYADIAHMKLPERMLTVDQVTIQLKKNYKNEVVSDIWYYFKETLLGYNEGSIVKKVEY